MDATADTTMATAPAATPAGSALTATIPSDFETFLRMLTAQIRNQDPLDPMKSTEFAVQLATFSGVEQQLRTNSLLETMAGGMGLSALAAYGDWVGREVRSAAPAPFDGTPLTIELGAPSGAARAELVVADETGAERQRLAIDPADETVTWAGTDEDGTPFGQGPYRFSVEGYDSSGALIDSARAETYQRVAEVRVEDGAAVLLFAGGGRVAGDAVTGLRDPEP
ncbi:flagellar basal-body rod modification protein FlgD [Rhodovulum iodosum]|uniref:Basal-body rod modification protein FlgD n=1 Tax=Rhodovulum iodosum TaxID=68291 RepID=A0ABV3XRE1_9RHOB|nr:flagellar hook capping FlgD N-terminal domain-containing protein [Rhodovulum robiginosum]RSK40009.1 flagellar basal body rod modification protein [Rhodovulum robiginosum]